MAFLAKHKLHLGLISILALLCMWIIPLTVSAYKDSLLVDGYELIVEGESWFVVDDKAKLLEILDEYKMSYLANMNEQAKVMEIDFVQNLEIVDVRVDEELFSDDNEVRRRIYEIEKEAVYYTVVRGDSVWAIAQTHDIPITKIIQLNPELNPEKIWAGNQILFEPQNPVLDVMMHLETTTTETIPYATEFIKDASLLANQRTVVKKGIEGEKKVTYDIRMLNGYEDEISIVHEEELRAPVGSVVKVGTKKTLMRISSKNFGIVSGTLSSGYGNRIDPISGRRRFHDGIDIATSYGAPVYAYADGTVVAAGWNGTRGNYVTIKHPNGLQTSYLHMSKLSVKKGQTIKVGQQVGAVGSTGYSTGNHLHFSVTKHGKNVNPWDYI